MPARVLECELRSGVSSVAPAWTRLCGARVRAFTSPLRLVYMHYHDGLTCIPIHTTLVCHVCTSFSQSEMEQLNLDDDVDVMTD